MDKEEPGFGRLRKAFSKFVRDHGPEDVGAKALRTLAAGGKAAVDRGLQEFPKELVTRLTGDFYTLLQSQDVAEDVSAMVRSFDEAKVKAVLIELSVYLQEDDAARMFAKGVKLGLQKGSNDDIGKIADRLLSGRPAAMRWAAKAFFAMSEPYLDEMRDAPVEAIAAKIKELAATLPVNGISKQVAAYTREASPEWTGMQLKSLVESQPSPQAAADIVHNVGAIASAKFDDMTRAKDVAEIREIFSALAAETKQSVSKTMANDNAAKAAFRAAERRAQKKDKKGGFKFW